MLADQSWAACTMTGSFCGCHASAWCQDCTRLPRVPRAHGTTSELINWRWLAAMLLNARSAQNKGRVICVDRQNHIAEDLIGDWAADQAALVADICGPSRCRRDCNVVAGQESLAANPA